VTAAATPTPPAGSTAAVVGRTAVDYRDIADALRNRVDLFGKTLAGLATLGTTAVGLSRISDLFPADGKTAWVVVACVSLAVAALAAIGIATRLMLVGSPIFMRADLDHNADLDAGTRAAVRPVFEDAAKRFGYTSLLGLQERERSLRSAAARTGDKDERARRTALADDVEAAIEEALARGQVVAIRRRATRAVTDPLAGLLYFAVIVGLLLFAIGADKVSAGRSDPIAQAKACGEARSAGATAGELARTNKICDAEGTPAKPSGAPPSAAEARAQLTAGLAATLEACAALVQKAGDSKSGPLRDADCAPVRKALVAMATAPSP